MSPTAASGVVLSGVGAAILTSLGIDPAALFWAFVGACVGTTFAPAVGRFRWVVVFCCVVLSCALFGAFLALRFTGGDQTSRDAFACLAAIGFHPFVTALATMIPAAMSGVLRRFGFGG